MAPTMSILEILNQPPGALAYHVILLFTLEAMCGMAWGEWQRMRRQEYRQMAWGFLALALLHVIWAVLEGLGWRGAIPGQTLSWLGPPLQDALYTLSWGLLAWSLLPLLQAPGKRWLLGGGLVAALLGIFGVVAVLIWRGAVLVSPAAEYGAHWLAYAWSGLRIALAAAALYGAIRRGAEHRLWLGVAFAALLIGQVIQLIQGRGIGFALASSWLRIAELLAYPLLALTVHQSIISDLFSYGLEFKNVSEESLRQTRELLLLLETTKATTSTLELDKVLGRIVENVVLALNADQCAIAYASPETKALQVRATYDPLHNSEPATAPKSASADLELEALPIVQHALERRQQVLSARAESNPAAQEIFRLLGSSDTGPLIIQPLASDERVLGLLLVGNSRSKRPFSQADGNLCQALATQVTSAIENAQRYQDAASQRSQAEPAPQGQETGGKRSQTILDHIAYGILASDASNKVTVANAAAARILGQPRQELIDHDILSLFPNLPAALLSGHQTLAEALDQQGQEALLTTVEAHGRAIRASLSPVTDQGQPNGILAILQEVGAEQATAQSTGDFVATASRELREPLNSLRGYADLLLQETVGPLNETQRRFLEKSQHHAGRMSELVDDLVDIAEIDHGPIMGQPRAVDVAEAIAAATVSVQGLIEEKRLTIDFRLQQDLPAALADPDALKKIIVNLLDNACKYTQVGGEIRVDAEVRDGGQGGYAAGRHIQISVQDNGVGIPAEEQGKIFERFYRAENPLSVEAGGAGLGLAVAKALAEANRGRIWVESEPGQGSTFSVALPIAPAGPPVPSVQGG